MYLGNIKECDIEFVSMSFSKVLIVEDELIIAKVCEMFFKQHKVADVNTVCCFKEAVETFEDGYPDLILMDIQLRGRRDGVELANYIRQYSNVPIIFSTGNGYKETIKKINEISNTKLLSKPIKFDQLEQAMSELEFV